MLVALFLDLLIQSFENIIVDIIAFIPTIVAAIIIILVGYGAGSLAGRAVNTIIEKMGVESAFDQRTVGTYFHSSGVDISSFVGSITKAFVVILSIILAIESFSLS